mmetsp:Transcript_47718/g.137835  ORF Transcript_47718/g.137835 Transcript_47718/m.137835 type:complete len:206 (+) Transcript_47718:521-1138(+)
MRRGSVSIPCRNIHELSGEMQPPRFLRGTVRIRKMYASGAKGSGRSCPQRSPPYEVSGLSKRGCRPPFQLNLPESTTMPPMPVPCPPVHLVREWQMTSTPQSRGFIKYGVVKVSSTITGHPFAWAVFTKASMSVTCNLGLDTVSVNTARVLLSMAAATAAWSLMSTNFVLIPNEGKMSFSMVKVPPYKCRDDTMLSPVSARFTMA